MDRFLSVKDVQEVLGISDSTVRNLVNSGKLYGIRVGKEYRISQESLLDFIGEGNKKPVAKMTEKPVDKKPSEKPAPIDPKIVIVTKHRSVLEWLNKRGIRGRYIPGNARREDVIGKVVYGYLTIPMALLAKQFYMVDLPYRSYVSTEGELTPEEMDLAGAHLIEVILDTRPVNL